MLSLKRNDRPKIAFQKDCIKTLDKNTGNVLFECSEINVVVNQLFLYYNIQDD